MRIIQYKTLLNEKGLPELVKEKASNYGYDKFSTPEIIANMMREVFQLNKQTEEYLYELCFSTNMKLIGVFEISHGGIDSTIANPREIYQKALICGAAVVAIVHNHPSMSCLPSNEDYKTVEKLKDAGNIIGIKLVDSIIIGGDTYFSWKESIWH